MRHPTLTQAISLSRAGQNDEAVALIRQLASTGEPEALHLLAEMTWRGGMVEQDPVRARTLYNYAASLGHAGAGVIATNLMASGIAGPRNWQGALNRLRSEAKIDAKRRQVLALIEAMKLDAEGDPAAPPSGKSLSEVPRAAIFGAILSEDECAHIMKIASADFQPSMVFDSERKLVRDKIRTSDGSTIHWLIEDPAIHALNRRFAAASGSSFDSGEALQVLRYQPGQEYRPHFDFVASATNRRMMTALIYLNDAYEGGATAFVRTDIRFKGTTGDMLLFHNAGLDGGPDPMSEHAGLPVTKGVKYLATRWIREGRWFP